MGTGLALPSLPQIRGLLSFPVSQVSQTALPLLLTSWPRGVPERMGLDFSAPVNQPGASLMKEKVSAYLGSTFAQRILSV